MLRSDNESSFKRHSDIMDRPLEGNVRDEPNRDVLNAKFIHRYNGIIIPFENRVADLERELSAIESKFGTDLETYRECSAKLDEARELVKAAHFMKPRYEQLDQLIAELKTKLNLVPLGWGGLNYIGMSKEAGDSPVLYFNTSDTSPLRFGFNFSAFYDPFDPDTKIGEFEKILDIIMFNVDDPHLNSLKTPDDECPDAPESFVIFEINHERDKYKQKLQTLFKDRDFFGNVLNSVRDKYLLRAEVEYFVKAVVDLIDEKYLDLFKIEPLEINISEDAHKLWLVDIGFSYGKMRTAYGGYE